MIPEIGQFTLILALVCSLLGAVVPTIKPLGVMYDLQKRLSVLVVFLVGVAMLCLAWSFITDDFTVAYVAQNSNSHLPLLYKIGAIWGAHEGSMLLWVCLLCAWTAAITCFAKPLPARFHAPMLQILAAITCGFLLFILATSNPFLRLLPFSPTDGRDLNPLLQDPGLVLHPPVLYMGYVGFAVPFAFACAALLNGSLEAAWARWLRPWVLMAWCLLTIGITMGSWWAYRELGWGGWWFWDPVENASFLPWLLGTALVHSILVTAKRGSFTAWTVLLSIGCFALSLIGTFLVRSGVLVSVHSFASDAQRGVYILGFLAVVLGGSLALYALKGRKLHHAMPMAMWSKAWLVSCNNALFVVLMLTVLLGTVYPLVIDALGYGKISVGPPYFNAVFAPLMVPVLALLAIVPLAHWGKALTRDALRRLIVSVLSALVIGVGAQWWLTGTLQIGVTLGVVLALTGLIIVIWESLHSTQTSRRWGMWFAHAGIAITVLGIVLSSAYSQHREVRLLVGDSVTVGPYGFTLSGVSEVPGPNYTALRAQVALLDDSSKVISHLYPEQRLYTVQKTALAKTAIDAGVFRDCYVALGQSLSDDAWALRIYYKPFIRWIWAGGFFMLFGGALSMANAVTRRRIPRAVAKLSEGE